MTKRYNVSIVVLSSLVILTSLILVDLQIKNNEEEKDILKVSFMEEQLTPEKLISIADLIVQGSIVEKIESIVYNSEEIETILSTYKFNITYMYKGDITESKEITISFAGTELPEGIEMGQTYVVYLSENKFDDSEVYNFVSLSQGIFKDVGKWINSNGDELDLELIGRADADE